VMRRCRYSSQNLGDWCSYGCLDPSTDGSEFYSGLSGCGLNASGSSNSSRANDRVGRFTGFESPLTSKGGKLEKSALNFVLTHRVTWSASSWDGYQTDDSGLGMNFIPAPSWTIASSSSSRGRQSAAPRTFWRPGTSSSSSHEPPRAIQLQDFAPPSPPQEDVGGGAEQRRHHDDSEEAQEGEEPPFDMSQAEAWGYAPSALTLLKNIEDFQQGETGFASSQHQLYTLLPEDLVALDLVAPDSASPSVPLAVGPGNCSSHFFWLELLYDFHSGRHASHLGDTGGGATFQLLERRYSDNNA